MKNWYVAKSKPQKEAFLHATLSELGVDVFFPRIYSRRQGHQRLEALFPTYLFCRFDVSSPDWPAIRWAPGLNYFLATDGNPSRVPDDMVQYIHHRVEDWNGVGLVAKDLGPGDVVKVANGPFAGIEGIFQRYVSAGQRCRILLHVEDACDPLGPRSELFPGNGR